MSPACPVLKMVLYVCTLSITSPVSVLTARSDITTLSLRYWFVVPIPRYLAPLPPVSTLVSYPTIPPSNIIPANNNGWTACAGSVSVSYCSRVLRTICLSLTKLSSPNPLSTTRNHVPFGLSLAPAALSESINKSLAPCVTAVLNEADPSLLNRCPVKSSNL